MSRMPGVDDACPKRTSRGRRSEYKYKAQARALESSLVCPGVQDLFGAAQMRGIVRTM
jgi:hypothetical protein